jgi:hypothetical protein
MLKLGSRKHRGRGMGHREYMVGMGACTAGMEDSTKDTMEPNALRNVASIGTEVSRYYCRDGLFGSECGLSMQLVCWSVSALSNPNRENWHNSSTDFNLNPTVLNKSHPPAPTNHLHNSQLIYVFNS